MSEASYILECVLWLMFYRHSWNAIVRHRKGNLRNTELFWFHPLCKNHASCDVVLHVLTVFLGIFAFSLRAVGHELVTGYSSTGYLDIIEWEVFVVRRYTGLSQPQIYNGEVIFQNSHIWTTVNRFSTSFIRKTQIYNSTTAVWNEY